MRKLTWLLFVVLVASGCTVPPVTVPPPDADFFDSGGAPVDAGRFDGGPPDAYVPDALFDPDGACAASRAEAMIERLPVDIIWVVDNSGSMADEIDQIRLGINAFADRITASGLDYRVIMISLRTPTTGRFPVCIPPPLAGPSCADGTRFFQIDVDIRSTQPIEQILGTLAQSPGYAMGESRGGPPWRHLLRDGATKTFVVVTDDNARTCALPGSSPCASGDPPLTATGLEDFPGGPNPFNSATLGPGILTAEYGDLFRGYTFNAIYGWGSDTDDTASCGPGADPGQTYTALVRRTGGVRAQVCDGPSAWGPFFESVASTVVRSSRIECDIALPTPPDGMSLNPSRVNVQIRGSSGVIRVPGVADMSGCDAARGGWYYDDRARPTRVILCPASCDAAQAEVSGETTGLDVLFGCDTDPI